jgi:hypothetical protein
MKYFLSSAMPHHAQLEENLFRELLHSGHQETKSMPSLLLVCVRTKVMSCAAMYRSRFYLLIRVVQKYAVHLYSSVYRSFSAFLVL